MTLLIDLLDIGFDGRRYRVPRDAYSAHASIVLPDSRIVHVGLWEYRHGKPRAVEVHQTIRVGDLVQAVPEPNKNYLLGRYAFRFKGVRYLVSQEVYPGAYIQLPIPNCDVVLEVGEWEFKLPLTPQIKHVHRVGKPDNRPRVWAIYADYKTTL